VALWEFAVVVLMLVGMGIFMYYFSLTEASKKLVTVGDMYGAAQINAGKDAIPTVDLLGQQTKMFMDEYKKESKLSITTLDPSILAECPVNDSSSSDEE
jgi:hypothetical protein